MMNNIFQELTKAFLADREAIKATTLFYISNGYYPTWAEEHRNDPDRGIKEYSTETRWQQYRTGKIDREKAVELAQKRAEKQLAKKTEAGLAKLEAASQAPELTFATVNVSWSRNYNATAEAWTNNGRRTGTAGGYGYDKQSAAVADAFNQDYTMLKVLYTIKEKALAAGQTDESRTACTGHDNRYIIGYGSGYSVIPYFEGGVGVECYWSILKKAGYITTTFYGRHEQSFRIEKGGPEA
jgi:hypothetical protein